MLTPEVEQAILELRASCPGVGFEVAEDGNGGALVTGTDFFIGDRFRPSRSWVAFAITFQYPATDVYPHFMRADLQRADGTPIAADGLSLGVWRGAPAVQISRRSHGWKQGLDTAAIKLMKVLEWLRGN
jgi:hypothetical protein